MSAEEEKRIRSWAERVPDGTRLRLVRTADRRAAEMEAFCAKLTALIPGATCLREEGPGQAYPFILLPNGVRYQAVPGENELEPFMEALAGVTPPLGAELAERLGAMRTPAALEVYVLPRCPHCPRTVRRAIAMAQANPLLQLTIVDAGLFPEMAERRQVGAAPTVLLDDRLRWTGELPVKETIDVLITRDPASLGPQSLEVMIKQGSAGSVAQMMVERDILFPAILELLCHAQWPTRLGAMVVVEELDARQPALARRALEALWERYEGESDPVKGDIAFLCGEIGEPCFAPRLEAVLRGKPVAEVREAAADALAKLRRADAGSRR